MLAPNARPLLQKVQNGKSAHRQLVLEQTRQNPNEDRYRSIGPKPVEVPIHNYRRFLLQRLKKKQHYTSEIN